VVNAPAPRGALVTPGKSGINTPAKSIWKRFFMAYMRWTNPRLVIALHSPDAHFETGLRICLTEKRPDSDRIECRTVRSLQSDLFANYRKYGHISRISMEEPQIFSRLRGGGRSLALTFLPPNSLLTGKITGNLRNFDLQNRMVSV